MEIFLTSQFLYHDSSSLTLCDFMSTKNLLTNELHLIVRTPIHTQTYPPPTNPVSGGKIDPRQNPSKPQTARGQ